MKQRTMRRGAAVMAALLPIICTLGGCMVGPDYKRPPAIISGHYKELAGWKPGTPSDTLDRGAWWSIYHDPLLDRLESQVATSNQTLRAQEAAFRQTVAVVAEARSLLFPTVGATASVTRSGGGGGGSGARGGTTTLTSPSLGGIGTGTGVGTGTNTLTTTSTTAGTGTSGGGFSRGAITSYDLSGTVDWELDLWGRIRRQVESDVAAAQASAADIASVRLSAEATLAIDYFEMRAADSLDALLNDTVRDYRQALQITLNQYNVGVAARGDVITAQSQLQSAITSFINVGVLRSQLEHAIAVLTGRAPADLTIPPERLPPRVPVVPPGIPSELLERRPDIAAAERVMREQNALIGVAVAAYYPQVTLSALYGYVGDPVQSLIQAANRIWSLGAAASESLFEGGARTAAVAAARATYDGAVANYRQTVLTRVRGRGGPALGAAHLCRPGAGGGRGGRARTPGGADRAERVSGRHAALHDGDHRAEHAAGGRAGGADHPAGPARGERHAGRGPRRRLDRGEAAEPGKPANVQPVAAGIATPLRRDTRQEMTGGIVPPAVGPQEAARLLCTISTMV